ncbi:hypothetical protein [Agromyces albus]|uniref:hypothetical protein n=1 Tax=Agromyces albus TaxID=205332 RepID=UPI0027808831|nr:hypothetical protein [Agromyces albus]MDQ0577706.1 hypothetical protein [Agromyces albus]
MTVTLYSDFPGRRTMQIVGDVFALVVLLGGIVVAVSIHNAIAAFDAIGRDVEQSGTGLASTMSDIGDSLAAIPLIGGSIRAPFDAASDAGGTLAAAGDDWQRTVQSLAAFTAWTVVGLVVLILLFGWIRPRITGIARRAAAKRLTDSPTSLDLLAFRALATRSPQDLARVNADVAGAWRRGDTDVIRQLAALELKASGIRLSGS